MESRARWWFRVFMAFGFAISASACDNGGHRRAVVVAPVGDAPTVAAHLDEDAIEAGAVDVDTLVERGAALFGASFNDLDGAGRPETTGTGAPRARREAPRNFNRISAPDSNSCAGCHNSPRMGGGGDNVANVFVLGQRLPFVNFDGGEGDGFQAQTLDGVADERNTLGMFGSGFVELLAREMSTDLQAIRAAALAEAAQDGAPVTRDLETKGVRFGRITARPDGSLDNAEIEGVDADLVIKPFHQKGAVVSLREFTNNAYNHHHGMQSAERFGAGADPDGDGVADELTVGDVTAATIFQATLPVPGRVLPADAATQAIVERGEMLFDSVGCATCHVRSLRLESPVFTEPNPFNPPGNLRPEDVTATVSVDLTVEGPGPHLDRELDGSVLVPLFSDLKRHDMGEFLDNEQLVQAGIPTNEWLTRKLWGMANEPPYLHHGRALTIDAAIVAHGGEAQAARDAYVGLSEPGRREIVDFLKTLQVLPEGTTSLVVIAN
ncbi:MAG: thiol oxidoreductase [Myxococcales bacterium]|nr:thiol oxidoreductase [Myxococcales bacterium]